MTTDNDASTGSRRRPWHELPLSVRTGIEDVLGGRVTAATSQRGGFSDGLAARVELADGRRAFAKAVDAGAAPAVAAFHRREGELVRVLDAMTGLAERLTPAPRLNSGDVSGRLSGWARLADSSRSLAELAVIAPDAARVALVAGVAVELTAPGPSGGRFVLSRRTGWKCRPGAWSRTGRAKLRPARSRVRPQTPDGLRLAPSLSSDTDRVGFSRPSTSSRTTGAPRTPARPRARAVWDRLR